MRDDKEFKKTKHGDGEESKAGEKEFRIRVEKWSAEKD